jgi:hypothetical protein
MKVRSKTRFIGAIVTTGAALVGGLAFAAPAEAATPPPLSPVAAATPANVLGHQHPALESPLLRSVAVPDQASNNVNISGRMTTATACGTQTIDTTNPDGSAATAHQVELLKDMVSRACVSTSSRALAPLVTSGSYGTVYADLTVSLGALYASGHALGIPYGTSKPRNELQCTYRINNAGSWGNCGYGTGTTYIYTSQLSTCPVPGQWWDVVVGLYVNGSYKYAASAGAYSR